MPIINLNLFRLKRLVPIVSIILLTAIASPVFAQTNPVPGSDNPILRFYPNPAISYVNVDVPKGFDKGFTLQVYNFLGKKVHETKNPVQRVSINLNDYNRGMYIYQLRDQSGKIVESGKFQVSK